MSSFQPQTNLCIRKAVHFYLNHPRRSIKKYGTIDTWDTQLITDMSELFRTMRTFNQPLNGWDVSNVVNMRGMFCNACAFNQSLDSWNVSNVKDMREMFYGALAFNQPLNSWDVVIRGAEKFNPSINEWTIWESTSMTRMFEGASAFNQPLGNWKITEMRATEECVFKNAMAFDVNNLTCTWPHYACTDNRIIDGVSEARGAMGGLGLVLFIPLVL